MLSSALGFFKICLLILMKLWLHSNHLIHLLTHHFGTKSQCRYHHKSLSLNHHLALKLMNGNQMILQKRLEEQFFSVSLLQFFFIPNLFYLLTSNCLAGLNQNCLCLGHNSFPKSNQSFEQLPNKFELSINGEICLFNTKKEFEYLERKIYLEKIAKSVCISLDLNSNSNLIG